MISEANFFLFGLVLWLVSSTLIFNLWQENRRSESDNLGIDDQSLEELKQQYLSLQQTLKDQNQTFQVDTFHKLQVLMTSYPTIRKLAQVRPNLPIKKLLPMFKALGDLIISWHYETIGQPWEQVKYNPLIHQLANQNLEPGDLVYINYVGYKYLDQVICRATVTRNLPGQQKK